MMVYLFSGIEVDGWRDVAGRWAGGHKSEERREVNVTDGNTPLPSKCPCDDGGYGVDTHSSLPSSSSSSHGT